MILLFAGAPALASTLSLPTDAGAPPGLSTVVPLFIDNATGLLGADILITYDPAVALATSVSRTGLSQRHSLISNLSTPGEIRISLFGTTPLSGGGALLSVFFNSVGALDAVTVLDLVSATLNEGSISAILEDGQYCVQGQAGEVQSASIELVEPGSTIALLSWGQGAFATAYNIYRGGQSDLSDLSCFASDVNGLSTLDDGAIPSVDGALYYLITDHNCRGEATLGFASSGGERANDNPCP